MIREQEAPATDRPGPFDAIDVRELKRRAEALLQQFSDLQGEQGKTDDKLRRLFKKWEKQLLRSRSLVRRRQKILDEIERRKQVKA